jgi:hypothetical protein
VVSNTSYVRTSAIGPFFLQWLTTQVRRCTHSVTILAPWPRFYFWTLAKILVVAMVTSMICIFPIQSHSVCRSACRPSCKLPVTFVRFQPKLENRQLLVKLRSIQFHKKIIRLWVVTCRLTDGRTERLNRRYTGVWKRLRIKTKGTRCLVHPNVTSFILPLLFGLVRSL